MLEYIIGYSTGQRAASRAASLARSAVVGDASVHSNRIENMAERIDAMAIVLRAMWSLLEEQGLTAERLLAKIEELDLADGEADFRVKRKPVACSQCNSMVAPGLTRCQFCGADLPMVPKGPFDRL